MSFDLPPLGQFCASWDALKFLDSHTVEDALDTSSPNQDMKKKMEEMVANVLSSDESIPDDGGPLPLEQQETHLLSPRVLLRASPSVIDFRSILDDQEAPTHEASPRSSVQEEGFFSPAVERSSTPSMEMGYSVEETSFLSELVCPSPQRTMNEKAFARFIEQLPSSSAREGDPQASSSGVVQISSPRIEEKGSPYKEDQDRISFIQRLFEIREEPERARFRCQRKHPSFSRQNSLTAPLPNNSSFSPSPKRLSPLSVEGHIEEQGENPHPSETI